MYSNVYWRIKIEEVQQGFNFLLAFWRGLNINVDGGEDKLGSQN